MSRFLQVRQNSTEDVDLVRHGKMTEDGYSVKIVQRDSLNRVLKQVPSNRSRKTLLPIINEHCLEGTIFHSDGWKAYGKLADQLDLEDCLHFPVNHSSNYVHPDIGAHT